MEKHTDMNNDIIKQIDELIDADRSAIAADVIKLVNIRSVRENPLPGAPFGAGPRKVLDTVMEMGRELGFVVREYENTGVISLALREGEIDMGIWAHGDVVHEGSGWNFEPYNAVEYKGCIVGRGATDNKGQLVSALHLLTMFKKLGTPLKYNPALFVGSDEEAGMADMMGLPGNDEAVGFINKFKAPRLSLVPDSSFPVGYGGKGSMRVRFRSFDGWEKLAFTAGTPDAPGRAVAILPEGEYAEYENCTTEKCACGVKITAETPPIHSAHPKPGGNMVTIVTGALLDNGLLTEADAKKAAFLKAVSLDVDGEMFGVKTVGVGMGDLTLALLDIIEVDGKIEFGINMRYPMGTTFEEVLAKVTATAAANGFEVVDTYCGVRPYLLDKDWEIITELNKISNEITGDDKAPYTLSGGTYAHCLPNGLAFGFSGNKTPDDFPKGYGGAHGKDECVSLDRLQRGMRIYARSMLALNEMDW